jgi:hypothetical protein
MVKSLSLAFVSGVAALAVPAFAQKYGSAGCGLGSIVIGPGEGFSQVSAATTNGTGYNSFAITSGTSNCVPASQMAAIENQESFMQNNYASLSKEMAQGQGETLVGLSETFGCRAEVQDEVASVLQKSHQKIFSAPGAMAALDRTKAELRAHESTQKGCDKLFI